MPVGYCQLKVFGPQQSSMHEADDAFLPIPSGVGKFLLSFLEEWEPDDRQGLEWVWQCLPLSTPDGMRNFLLLQVRWKVQHRELKDRCRCETESMNPKERQCYWVVHDYEISTKDDVACSWEMKDT